MEYPEEGTVRHMRPANIFSGGQRRSPTPAPVLGEHSAEILRDAGVTEERISRLLASGVVVAAPGPTGRRRRHDCPELSGGEADAVLGCRVIVPYHKT